MEVEKNHEEFSKKIEDIYSRITTMNEEVKDRESKSSDKLIGEVDIRFNVGESIDI